MAEKKKAKKTPAKKASAKKQSVGKKAVAKKNPTPKKQKIVKQYTDIGFDLMPETANSDETTKLPEDSILQQVNGRTLLAFKQNETTKVNFSLIIHAMVLLLIVFLTSCGVAAGIKGILAVYTKVIGVSTAFILPMSVMFLGFGFLMGYRTWLKRCKNLFRKAIFATLTLLLLSLSCAFLPELIGIIGVQLVSLLSDSPINVAGKIIITVPFILIYMVLLGYLISLFVPALSVVDIWHREKLRLKNYFVFPPKVRKWLSTWVLLLFGFFAIGFFLVFSVLTKIFDNVVFEQSVWFIISGIFLFTAIFGNLIYLIYKPKDFDSIIDSSISLERTSVGFKLFGTKSRILSLFGALFGLVGTIFLILITIRAIGTIEHVFQNDSFLVLSVVLPSLCLGFLLSVLLLRYFTPRLIILISTPIFILVEYALWNIFLVDVFNAGSIHEFGFTFFVGLHFLLCSMIFSALVRSIRVMFEADVFQEGKFLSKVLGGAFIIGSIESLILLIYFDSPGLLMLISFVGFIACIVLYIIISPAGCWRAREEIYRTGETFVEKGRNKMAVVVSFVWSIFVIAAAFVIINSSATKYANSQSKHLESEIKYYDDYVVKKDYDHLNKIDTKYFNGEIQAIDDNQPDYSVIGGYIGLLSQKDDIQKAAIISDSPNKFIKIAKHFNIKTTDYIQNYFETSTADFDNKAQKLLDSPLYWLNSTASKLDYFVFEISPINEKHSIFVKIIKGLSEKLTVNASGVISINIELLNTDFIDNIISEVSKNFKNSTMFYLPDRILIFTEKPTIKNTSVTEVEFWQDFNVPDSPAQLISEFRYWKLRGYNNKLNNIEPKYIGATISAMNKLKYDNLKYILTRYVNSDSLAEKVIKSQISLMLQNFDKSREIITKEAKGLYDSLHSDNNRPDFNKTPIRTVYNQIYAEVFYSRALKSLEKAADSRDNSEKKRQFENAIMQLNNALGYKSDDIRILILAAEVAEEQLKIELAESFRNRIRKIYPAYFSK